MWKIFADRAALRELENRLRTILPEEYQDCYEDIQPVSMGSAALKYGSDGKVAWDDIWGTFCDLAMAGGPPHKGTLLEPGSVAEIEAQPDRYAQVVEEICRGVALVTNLNMQSFPRPGWIGVECEGPCMTEWLVRAIVMENVSVLYEDATLYLPAGPAFRIEKEIKNVITAVAKTCHYWLDHTWLSQQNEMANLFAQMAVESPLLQPAFSEHETQLDSQPLLIHEVGETIFQRTGLRPSERHYQGWLGVECPDVHAAVWMMRALVVSNVLSRREGTVLFVPLNSATDPAGEIVIKALERIHRFAKIREIL